MFTLQEIQLIVQKHLNTKNVEVLQYETSSNESPIISTIKAKISISNTQREVRLVAKPFLYPLDFKKHDKIPDFGADLIPTYFIKGNVVVLEDFSENGFVWAKSLDLDHIQLILQTLAKHHAENIDFEEKNVEKLEKLAEKLDDCSRNLEKDFEILEKPLFEALKSLKALNPEEDLKENLSALLKDSLQNVKDNFRKVLCHGFLCRDAALFKYRNNAPVECKLLNFGAQQYKPPSYDLLHFIYTTTDLNFRKNHLHELLKFYYDCIKAELGKINLDAAKLIPLEEDFELSIHHLLPLIKVQIAHLRQIQHLNLEFKTDEIHEKMVAESIKELKDLVINPGLTVEDCFQIIHNKIGTENYELLDYELTPLTVNGFFGDHKRLKIKISLNNEFQTLNFFVKFTPKGEAQKSIADDCDSFYKENFFYRHFVRMARKFGATMINDCTVPCYFTRLNDVLVFEDFGIRNYGILNHREPLSYQQVEIVVKQMAKFHASSLVVEETLTEQTKTKYCLKEHHEKGLQESYFTNTPNHQGAKSWSMAAEVIEDEIKLFPDPNSTLSDKDFKERIRKAYKLIYELVKPSKEYRNVICHGDLWVSNILVQQKDGKSTDCRFIDFQVMRYCPPAHDLLGFLHLTTNRSFRKAHLNDVIDLYHGELSKALEECGCDVEKIYPYDNFKKSIEYMLPQAICQTAIYYQICITKPELMKEYVVNEEQMKRIFLDDRRDFIVAMCERDSLYKERNGEAIQDLRELCTKYF